MTRAKGAMLALAALALSVRAAEARPVSYVGAWTLIEETDRQMTSVLVHYTPNPRLSLGWRSEWDRKARSTLHGPQATILLKRWYGEDHQANFYGFVGAGVSDRTIEDGRSPDAALFAGAMADWETRRLFASYRNRVTETGTAGDAFMQAVRLGVAPYVGDTGDLHTWLMVEIDHRPENAETIGVTPLLRFFKGPLLLELGWSVTDAEPLANFTWRF